MNIKQQLYNACQEFVQNKLQTIENTIQSNKNALNSETKSSAGDKHETGRAMLQLEMEKAGQQLKEVRQMQEQVARINAETKNNIGCLGSLIMTEKFNYYLAISMGQITIDNTTFFIISTQSPIGKLLVGKTEKDTIVFNNQNITIQKIY